MFAFAIGWMASIAAGANPSQTREAVYTNLSPGPYRFRVMASNPDGVWSSNEATVAFAGRPAILADLVVPAQRGDGVRAGSLRSLSIRLHQLTSRLNVRFEERLAERTRIAQELHDTLLQGFLSASMQVHVAADRLPAGLAGKAAPDPGPAIDGTSD